MKLSNRTLLTKLFILAAVMSPPSRAQTPAQKTAPIANAASHPGNTFVLENLDHDSAIFRLSFGSSV